MSPSLFGTIGSGTLQVCLGALLFDNSNKLLISSNSSNKVAVWDLTSNPTSSGSWTSMGELALGQSSKRFAGIVNTGLNQWEVYLATRYTGRKLSVSISGATATVTSLATYTPGAGEYNDATVLGNKFIIQSYLGTAEPILNVNLNMTLNSSQPTNFWSWSAETNSANSKAFIAGNGGAFYGIDAFGNPIQTAKFNFDCWVRGSDFAQQGDKEYLYALCSNGLLNVYEVTDITNPVLVKKGTLTSFDNETYSIRVKPNSNTAIVVSNGGDFLVLDLQNLSTATTQYPVSP